MDWELFKDNECIKVNLVYSYKIYMYDLHNIYKMYPSKEAASSNDLEEISEKTWKQICEQWDKKEYKVKETILYCGLKFCFAWICALQYIQKLITCAI